MSFSFDYSGHIAFALSVCLLSGFFSITFDLYKIDTSYFVCILH